MKIRITADFWLFIAAALVLKKGYLAALYTVAVVLHECAHYFVARRLFYACKEIRLGIFGAVLYGDFRDVCGTDRIKIALAGPACNLCLCALCLAVWWLLPDSYYFTRDFYYSNLTMACVNLLPCYPLDGGRVLCGVIENKLGCKAVKVTKFLTFAVSSAAFLIFVISLFTPHKLFNVALFALGIMFGAVAEGGDCYVKTALLHSGAVYRRGMEKKTLVFDGESRVCDVARRIRGNFLYCLEVVDADMRVRRRYDVAQLESLVIDCPRDMTLNDAELYLRQRQNLLVAVEPPVEQAVKGKDKQRRRPHQQIQRKKGKERHDGGE